MASGLYTPLHDPSIGRVRPGSAPRRPPVIWFAVLGGLILLVSAALLIAWISGPDFARVPQGPDQPPTFMRIALDVGQILMPLIAAFFVYWFILRPWIRERRVTYDGLLLLAGLSASVYDSFSVAAQPWFAYNSHLLNYGNPLSALPGWISLNEPGRAIAWSFPTLPAFYAVAFPLIGIIGCAVLRSAKRLFPRLNRVGLLIVCIVAMAVFELFLEGVLFLPLGFWTYAGGAWPILFGGHYYQLPVNEFLHITPTMVALVFLRYSVNDRGQSIVQRGVDQIKSGPIKLAAIQLLAVVAAIHLIAFALYHIPQTFWALNSHEWPKDVTDRSYFQNQCGRLVDRACPGPGVPITRPDSGYVNWDGQYVYPPNR